MNAKHIALATLLMITIPVAAEPAKEAGDTLPQHGPAVSNGLQHETQCELELCR
jgi:hypothetical protein